MCLSQLCFSSSLYQAVFLSTAGLLGAEGTTDTLFATTIYLLLVALKREQKKKEHFSTAHSHSELRPSSGSPLDAKT